MKTKLIVIGGVLLLFIFLIGSYFLLSGGSQLQVKILSYSSNDSAKPKAEVKQSTVDLGKMKVSDQKDASFTLANVGQKPLQISNVSSSCSCTVGTITINGKESQEFGMHNVSDYVGAIDPGKEAIVKVIYRPYVMPVYGPIERELYVTTNDPLNSKLVFKVIANVK